MGDLAVTALLAVWYASAAADKARELIERNAALVAHIFVGEVAVTGASLLKGWVQG